MAPVWLPVPAIFFVLATRIRGRDISRPFDHKRFAAIRNYLSSLGLLDWQDNKYRPGWTDWDGQYHGGKACRWQASELLIQMLDWEKVQDPQEVVGNACRAVPSFRRVVHLARLSAANDASARQRPLQSMAVACTSMTIWLVLSRGVG